MTMRKLHGWFLLLAVPVLALSSGTILRSTGRWNAPQIHAWAWAVATSIPHFLLGWLLWKRNSGTETTGIASGLSVLGVRFLFGAASFMTGFVMCSGEERLFALLWTGIFLILCVFESLFFVQGVQEL